MFLRLLSKYFAVPKNVAISKLELFHRITSNFKININKNMTSKVQIPYKPSYKNSRSY